MAKLVEEVIGKYLFGLLLLWKEVNNMIVLWSVDVDKVSF